MENVLSDSALRCPNCKLIPNIKVDLLNNILEYKCSNNHHDKDDFKNIYDKLILYKNLNKIKCCICSQKGELYCYECSNFFCKKEPEFENDIKKHFFISIKNIDNYCFKDNEKYAIYCKTHNIPLCADCQHKDNNCELIRLNQIDIPNDKIENYSKKLLDFNNKIITHNQKYIEIFEKLLNFFNSYILKTKEIINNLKINYHYLFYDDLLKSYKYKKNIKCYNYNTINNIYENFEKSFDLKEKNNIYEYYIKNFDLKEKNDFNLFFFIIIFVSFSQKIQNLIYKIFNNYLFNKRFF